MSKIFPKYLIVNDKNQAWLSLREAAAAVAKSHARIAGTVLEGPITRAITEAEKARILEMSESDDY